MRPNGFADLSARGVDYVFARDTVAATREPDATATTSQCGREMTLEAAYGPTASVNVSGPQIRSVRT